MTTQPDSTPAPATINPAPGPRGRATQDPTPYALAAVLVAAGMAAVLLRGGRGGGEVESWAPIAPALPASQRAPALREGAGARIDPHGQASGPLPGSESLPEGHPPVGGGGSFHGGGGGMAGAQGSPHGAAGAAGPASGGAGPMAVNAGGSTDGHAELPLKASGINGRQELDRGLASAKDPEARRHLEEGFRLAFTVRQDRRDYARAEGLLRQAIERDPRLAPAYRALGYAVFNQGMRFDAAIPLYEQAIAVDPEYGEAHYALAFFLGESDRARGATHFQKAMSLGVPDERGLGPRYYPGRR